VPTNQYDGRGAPSRRHSKKFYAPRGGDLSIPLPSAPIAVRAFCHWAPKNQTMALACPAIRGKIFSECELPHTSRPIPDRCRLTVGGSRRSSGECRIRGGLQGAAD
jgi:hypothetical protein